MFHSFNVDGDLEADDFFAVGINQVPLGCRSHLKRGPTMQKHQSKQSLVQEKCFYPHSICTAARRYSGESNTKMKNYIQYFGGAFVNALESRESILRGGDKVFNIEQSYSELTILQAFLV